MRKEGKKPEWETETEKKQRIIRNIFIVALILVPIQRRPIIHERASFDFRFLLA